MFEVEEPPAEWVPDDQVVSDDLTPVGQLGLVAYLEEQETAEAAEDLAEMDADAVLAAVAASQRPVNLAQARQLFLAARWADLHGVLDRPLPAGRPSRGRETLIRPGGVGTPELAEFAPAELGVVLGLSVVSARLLIADALDLRHRLPRLWHRLQTGSVRVWMARRVANRTRHLSTAAAANVDARLGEVVGRVAGGRFEKILDAAIITADSAQAAVDAATAAARQGVWVSRDLDDGYATLVGRAPAPDIAAVDGSLDQLARALTILGDTDSHDLRRAKALSLLADPTVALETIRLANETLLADEQDGVTTIRHDGTDPRRRPADLGSATLYVHITDQTLADAVTGTADGIARVGDVGPVLIRQVSGWLGHRQVTVRPVLNIPGIAPVDRYEFTDPMGEALRMTSPAGYFPYATNTSGRGDNDHPDPYLPPDQGGPPGQTGLHNGAWTPRLPHRIKTHSRWTVKQLRPGAWLWRTPHGHHYLVDHAGTTPLGTLRN